MYKSTMTSVLKVLFVASNSCRLREGSRVFWCCLCWRGLGSGGARESGAELLALFTV